MSTSPRPRRSRAFRPNLPGLEALESLILLSGDPFLPNPAIDFDPNDYTLADEATYDANLATIDSMDAHAPPGELSAHFGSTWNQVRYLRDIRNKIKDAYDRMTPKITPYNVDMSSGPILEGYGVGAERIFV